MSNVKDLLESSIYCTVATVNDNGTPWSSPVFFGYDDRHNLYWRSSQTAQHSHNLDERPVAAVTVFDSHMDWGTGKALYLSGEVTCLHNKDEITAALEIMDRRSGRNFPAEDFMSPNPRRIYKFRPLTIWQNIDGEKDGKFVDVRKELELPV